MTETTNTNFDDVYWNEVESVLVKLRISFLSYSEQRLLSEARTLNSQEFNKRDENVKNKFKSNYVSEPHTISEPSSEQDILESDNKVIKDNYINRICVERDKLRDEGEKLIAWYPIHPFP